jgi:hypothetical protein
MISCGDVPTADPQRADATAAYRRSRHASVRIASGITAPRRQPRSTEPDRPRSADLASTDGCSRSRPRARHRGTGRIPNPRPVMSLASRRRRGPRAQQLAALVEPGTAARHAEVVHLRRIRVHQPDACRLRGRLPADGPSRFNRDSPFSARLAPTSPPPYVTYEYGNGIASDAPSNGTVPVVRLNVALSACPRHVRARWCLQKRHGRVRKTGSTFTPFR